MAPSPKPCKPKQPPHRRTIQHGFQGLAAQAKQHLVYPDLAIAALYDQVRPRLLVVKSTRESLEQCRLQHQLPAAHVHERTLPNNKDACVKCRSCQAGLAWLTLPLITNMMDRVKAKGRLAANQDRTCRDAASFGRGGGMAASSCALTAPNASRNARRASAGTSSQRPTGSGKKLPMGLSRSKHT